MSELSTLAALDELAAETGLFNWQLFDAKYINPDGVATSFAIVSNKNIPITQFLQGAIDTYKFLSGTGGFGLGGDPNKYLFNTSLDIMGLTEGINRKYAITRVPFANYDLLVDQGVGHQRIKFTVLFTGTMYLTALYNFVQVLFSSVTRGTGTLNHPIYGAISNVLPISLGSMYRADSLNSVFLEVTFLTSDIAHLNTSPPNSLAAEIGKWALGVQAALDGMGGAIAAGNSFGSDIRNQL